MTNINIMEEMIEILSTQALAMMERTNSLTEFLTLVMVTITFTLVLINHKALI